MILGKLKEATREEHENLESIVDIMDSSVEMDGYKRLISQFYRFYAAIEPVIAGCDMAEVGFDLEKRRKLTLLQRDVTSLEISNSIPEWTDLPEIDTHAKAFGALYVLEGATLGGQIITRHLKQNLGIDADSGCAFFNSYGDQVGPMWKAFGAAITEFAEKNGDDKTIVNMAKETFDSFARCFSQDINTLSNAKAV